MWTSKFPTLSLRSETFDSAHLPHGHDQGEKERYEHEVEEAGGAIRRTKACDETFGSGAAAAREDVGGGVEDVAAGSAGAGERLVGGEVANRLEGRRAGAEMQKVQVMSLRNFSLYILGKK